MQRHLPKIALAYIIENFQEFLENLFDAKKKTNAEELTLLDSKLKTNYNITFLEITENEYETIALTLEKIDSITLDKIALLIYRAVTSKKKTELIDKFKTNKEIFNRLMQLIQLSEKKSNKVSVERNNLKNSVQQKLNAKA
ncbi:hypothetical protein [uncultured Flavobacterium sp.]|uniref:hypothetical protein n=1 Tax=uncultured Flavobacterium sp. TaxID=165435 RepID=UPI0030C7C80B